VTDVYDIAIYILDKKKATWTELERYFVRGKKEVHISRQTLSKFLKKLINEKLVTKAIDKESLKPVYVVKDEEQIEHIRWVRETERKVKQALESKDLLALRKILEDLLIEASSLRGLLKTEEKLINREFIRLSKYLFGMNKKELKKYYEEWGKEGLEASRRFIDEDYKLGMKYPYEEYLIKREELFEKMVSEPYEGIDGFIIWLIEKKGLKLKKELCDN